MRRCLRLPCPSNSVLDRELHKFARYQPVPLSLQNIIDFGTSHNAVGVPSKERNSLLFLRSELPVRIAHLIQQFDAIQPRELLQTASARIVRGWYVQAFKELMAAPSVEDLKSSDELLKNMALLVDELFQRHTPVVETMAQAIVELKQHPNFANIRENLLLPKYLDTFYTTRICVRTLVQQHLEMFDRKKDSKARDASWIGMIDPQCKPRDVVAAAADTARMLCEQHYAASPAIDIAVPLGEGVFPYIPSHIYYICFELLKNSLRAVAETHADKARLPPVRIVVVEGEEDLVIRISDEGGGIPRSGMPYIWSYLYSTAKLPAAAGSKAANHQLPADAIVAPLAGYGCGLPLSRVYARYFGGDLCVMSIERFGTDAYVFLKRAAAGASEMLPRSMVARAQ